MPPSTNDDLEHGAQPIEHAGTEAQRRAAQVRREESGAGAPGADENAAGFLKKPVAATEDEDADPVGGNE